MDRHQQHGEFTTSGLSQTMLEQLLLPIRSAKRAGARFTASARALRIAPFRAPAAGLMILAVTLATGTDILRATEPVVETQTEADVDPVEIEVPEPLPTGPATKPAGTPSEEPLDEDIDGPVDEVIAIQPDDVCVPERIKALPEPTGPRIAWGRYLPDEERSSIVVKDLPDGQIIDVSGGCEGYDPSFIDGQHLSYDLHERVDGEYRFVVMTVDLATGEHQRVTTRPNYLMAHSWDPSGELLATIDQGADGDGNERSTIEILHPATGEASVIEVPAAVAGRCGWLDDESALHWSPDGSKIALVMTAFDNDATLRVYDLDGRELIEPRAGTMARWLDATTLLYRDYDEHGRWHAVDTTTGVVSDLDLRAKTYGAAISPNGARVVTFDDQGTMYVHTLANGRERVHTGAIYPMWLDERHVLATDVERCSDECYFEFQDSDSATIIDVVDGDRTKVDTDALWEAAIWLPATS